MKKIVVIGIGNLLRKDDGIGIILLEKIIKRKNELPKNIDYIDGGTGGINLLHLIQRYETIIFLDAVNFNGKVGESKLIKLENIKQKNIISSMSTHSFDILKVIEISKKIDKNSKNIFIFAVQVKDVSFGLSISKELNKKIKQIVENLMENIKKIKGR